MIGTLANGFIDTNPEKLANPSLTWVKSTDVGL